MVRKIKEVSWLGEGLAKHATKYNSHENSTVKILYDRSTVKRHYLGKLFTSVSYSKGPSSVQYEWLLETV